LLHVDLFKNFSTHAERILLYVARCGKTSSANDRLQLTKQLGEKTGAPMKETSCTSKVRDFEHVGGRSEGWSAKFSRPARETRDGFMPFLFIDEAESISGTRRASRHSNILHARADVLCGEDGIDSFKRCRDHSRVNRADLNRSSNRARRIDRKIKYRPNARRPEVLIGFILRLIFHMTARLAKKPRTLEPRSTN